jgi:hypothetical protein
MLRLLIPINPILRKKIWGPYIVLDPEKNDLSSEGHLTKKLFLLFSVLLHKNEYIPGVLTFKIKFSSKIDPPYCTVSIHLQMFVCKNHLAFIPLVGSQYGARTEAAECLTAQFPHLRTHKLLVTPG